MATVLPLDMFQGNRFIFFDESGNMEFSPKSLTYVVVLALNVINSPEIIMDDYWHLRHDLYVNPPPDTGTTEPYRNRRFHAAEDPWVVRKRVFDLITANIHLFQAHAVALDKNDVLLFNRKDDWLFENLYYWSIRSIAKHSNWLDGIGGVHLLIDQTQVSHLRASTIGGIIRAKHEFGIPYNIGIHHVTSYAHPFLQLADYFSWAVSRKYEKGDTESYDLINQALAYVRVVFKK